MRPPSQQVRRAAEERKLSYRHELGNDRWIVEAVFPGLEGGFFVEAGATNGVNGSGTYVLEKKLGWEGICVEVIPPQFERLAQFRSCRRDNRALWSVTGEHVEFSIFPERTGLSGVSHLNKNAPALLVEGQRVERIQAMTVTLMDLLCDHHAPPVVDYLCLDVEGAEREVIGAFDFDGPYRLSAVSIEGHACDEIMEAAGYHAVSNPFTTVAFETYWLHPSVG